MSTLAVALLFAALAARGALALDNGFTLPALAWSSWNHYQGDVSDSLLRAAADAMVSSGLRDAGYTSINLDDGWAHNRSADGTINPDPALFPQGLKPVIDYVHSKGLSFGIYTARGSTTCMGRPGSDSHEQQDADTYAAWGVDFLKEDSCGGTEHGSVYEQYARMRDALNKTGRAIFFSITEAVPWTDHYERMHCYGDNVFTTKPWVAQGLDVVGLSNSALVEYCNNEDVFGSTAAAGGPGGMLSQLDSQQLLTYDNLTVPGFTNDNDMLEICNGGQTAAEYRAQFSTWAILASNLILGHDIINQSPACLEIIANKDVIAVNQDPLVVRGKLVLQWPSAVYPTTNGADRGAAAAASSGAAGALERTLPRRARAPRRSRRGVGAPDVRAPYPLPTSDHSLAPCNASAPEQLFAFDAATRMIRNVAAGDCVTYGGYHEANVHGGACVGWTAPGIGSQLWAPSGAADNVTLSVVDNTEKALDVIDCNVDAPDTVQVCTFGGADCYSSGAPPAGCGVSGQLWAFDASGAPTTIASSVGGAFASCVARVAPPPPPIILQVWSKPLANGDVALLAFNRDTSPVVANLTVAFAGWPPGASASLYDVWAHKPLGQVTGAWSVNVAPHDVYMVRATRTA